MDILLERLVQAVSAVACAIYAQLPKTAAGFLAVVEKHLQQLTGGKVKPTGVPVAKQVREG